MTPMEEKIIAEAQEYLKTHKRELIERFADPRIYSAVDRPASLFMAGSPGAGKTEVSQRLIEQYEKNVPVRIDADEIRAVFPGYTGTNSSLFQTAATRGVHELFNYVLDKNINALLDGTFAYEGAMQNIERSLKRGRRVEIYYIFQDPIVAWNFTKAREVVEGRVVPRDVFINAFVAAQENVNKAKEKFGSAIELNAIIKDFTTGEEATFINIMKVDDYIKTLYTREELEKTI